jgi:LL-diaminopimelate aminotransferase
MSTINTSERLNGIGEYYFSQKLREIDQLNQQGKNIINLGIGSPDLPPHPDVIAELQQQAALPNTHAYQSYKGAPALRKAMAGWYKQFYGVALNPDTEILPLIGSKEGIMHICMTFLNPGDIALVPNPGYPTYRSAVQLAGGTVAEYELKEHNHYEPDFDALAVFVKENPTTKLLFANYPHMPTGQLPDPALFEKLVAFAKANNILIVHDNPYSFILNDQPMSLLATPGAKDVVLELNSLSKSHNMAGWRIGLLCGAPELINEVLRFKSNMDSGMFLPAQLAAAKALQLPATWNQQLNEVYARRRNLVWQILDTLQCQYNKNQAGLFVWANITSGFKDGYELSDHLLHNAGVFITPGGIFGSAGNAYIRISLCSTEEKLQTALQKIQALKPSHA